MGTRMGVPATVGELGGLRYAVDFCTLNHAAQIRATSRANMTRELEPRHQQLTNRRGLRAWLKRRAGMASSSLFLPSIIFAGIISCINGWQAAQEPKRFIIAP